MSPAEVAGPTVDQSLRHAVRLLGESGIATARLDAEILLADSLGCDRIALYSHPHRRLQEIEWTQFNKWINRRAEGENVAYIRGRKEFYSLVFTVNPAVLIPRPETELLVDGALEYLHGTQIEEPRVLDLATGSGCIAVAIARYHSRCRVTASDISGEALDVAQRNAADHNVSERIQFIQSDGLGNLGGSGPFHVIVSNPPYVRSSEIDQLDAGIRRYEPRLALDGGSDGLDFYRRILPELPPFLTPGGIVLFEIGWDQGGAVTEIIKQFFPGRTISMRQDGAGRERVIEISKI